MTQVPPMLVTCRDGCGRAVPHTELEHSGWSLLPISLRWRCPACTRELQQAILTNLAQQETHQKTHQGGKPDVQP